MAYTTPSTFATGTTLTAADLNILGDDIVYLKGLIQTGVASLSSASGNINNTETVAISYTIPANSLSAGSTFRITAHPTVNWGSGGASSYILRFRCGPTTLTGNIAATRTMVATTSASDNGFTLDGTFTVRTIGAGGTCLANYSVVGDTTQPFAQPTYVTSTTGTVAIDTTVDNRLELTVQGSTTTTQMNVRDAVIMLVRT